MPTINITTITVRYPGFTSMNHVAHTCTMEEFARDIRAEARKFAEKYNERKIAFNATDLFWHLDEYCEKTYGRCQWQGIDLTHQRI